jgi:hypothetical protein
MPRFDNEDGTWLALGAVAVAAGISTVRSRQGSAATQLWIPDKASLEQAVEDPATHWKRWAWVSATDKSGWSQPVRFSVPTPSYETARAWYHHFEKDPDYKRVDISSNPSRSARRIWSLEWLRPDGDLARDLKIKRTIGGLYLVNPGDFKIPIDNLPVGLARRLRTIAIRNRHKPRYTNDDQHRAAMAELLQEICGEMSEEDGVSTYTSEAIGELGWLKDHPYTERR